MQILHPSAPPIAFSHEERCKEPGHPKSRALGLAFASLMLVAGMEITLGIWSDSLAVLADAGHLFSDAWLLGFMLLIASLTHRLTHQVHRRLERCVAFGSVILLLCIGVAIVCQACLRLYHPPTAILSLPMMTAAVMNLGVNGWSAWLLLHHSHEDHSVRAVCMHMAGDACGAIGVLLAALGIGQWGWIWVDGLTGLLVGGLIGVVALDLLMRTLNEIRCEH